VNKASLLGLEKEKQHLQHAVNELELEVERLRSQGQTPPPETKESPSRPDSLKRAARRARLKAKLEKEAVKASVLLPPMISDDLLIELQEALREFHYPAAKRSTVDLPGIKGPAFSDVLVSSSDPPAVAFGHTEPKRRRGRPLNKAAADRRETIQGAAAKGLKGAAYCEELGRVNLSTPYNWQKSEGCPKKYLDAYHHTDLVQRKKWRNRIADEKYQATKREPLVKNPRS
jgi:hypothetical protein